jgi:hypothetical protein
VFEFTFLGSILRGALTGAVRIFLMTSNVDSLLNQIKRNLGLPISSSRNGNEFGNIIDAAPFVASFAKGERIYRMADWTASADARSGSNQSRIRGSTSGLTGLEAGDDWTLSLTESSKPVASGRKVLGPRAARGVLPPRSSATASRSQNRPPTAKVTLFLNYCLS